jgi:hypothetical protein
MRYITECKTHKRADVLFYYLKKYGVLYSFILPLPQYILGRHMQHITNSLKLYRDDLLKIFICNSLNKQHIYIIMYHINFLIHYKFL